MEPAIRGATAQDYDALCDLIGQVDALHRDSLPHLFQEPEGPARSLDYILGLLADENVGLLVAELEGKVVGFVHIAVKDSPPIPIFVPRRFALVDNLVVMPDVQRQGVGRTLMNAVHAWARAKGAIAVELSVYEFNESAVAFYKAQGYETLSRRMSKSL